ncbi:hypothetical protein BGZ80_008602 [Entomortierella chlamydospora]|uniref:Uncharacterized protein n=1 Tax=Entomortierella chlamydospora TaxID=101097 RepID=A0A9P6MYB5_9FUNG|nr:hypothetical protein BGZ80_008602 [Entomortierella chlamydospora]
MSVAAFPHEPIRRSNKHNDSRLEDHPIEVQELHLEPEPPAFHRLFVLTAIVIFLGAASSSVPNLLAARHPREQPSRASKGSSGIVSSAKASLGLTHDPAQHPQNSDIFTHIDSNPIPLLQKKEECEGLPAYGSLTSLSNIEKDKGNAAIKHTSEQCHDIPDYNTKEYTVRITSSAQTPPSPSSTINVIPIPLPDRGHEHNKPWKTPAVEEAKVRRLVQDCAWLSFQVTFWIIKRIYLAVVFVIAKPIGAAAAFAETPFVITRDICKAFLPVYSFFTVAAVVGITVGGFALWIAQLLIAAIGADREKKRKTIVLVQSNKNPYARSFEAEQKAGTRSDYHMDLNLSSANTVMGWETGVNSTRLRSKLNFGTPLGINVHRKRGAGVMPGGEDEDDGEDEYDEDDDDDDDDDEDD